MYTLEHGRPLDITNRIEKEVKCYDLLDSLNIDYDRIDHDAIFDMNELEKVREILGVSVNKNLFLCNAQETKFYLLLMPAKKPFKTKELSKQINSSRLSFAKEERLKEILDLSYGSVNILSLMNDKDNKVQLLIDEDILINEYMGLHPMINTSSLKIKNNDIITKFLPFVHHNYIKVKLIGE